MSPEEYFEWLSKFEPKRTTDECFTPPAVMETVERYVAKKYNVPRETFCRPFYPGGDYQREDYTGKIVVDNPPFSKLKEILQFYVGVRVKFFLFAPGLTLPVLLPWVTYIPVGCRLKYANGAEVNTAFVTNMEPWTAYRTDPELGEEIRGCQVSKAKSKLDLPPNYITAAMGERLARHGKHILIPWDEVLGKQHNYNGRSIYGGAFELECEVKEYDFLKTKSY